LDWQFGNPKFQNLKNPKSKREFGARVIVLAQDGFGRAGQGREQCFEEVTAIRFREVQGTGDGVHEAQERLFFVTGESLQDGQGIDGKGDAEDEGVPAMGGGFLDGAKVALEQAVIAQRAQPFELVLSYPAAGAGKGTQHWLIGHGLIEGDEFACFVPAGMAEGPLDGGQLEGNQNLRLIDFEKLGERLHAVDVLQLQRMRGRAEANQTVGRAELLDQRMPVAEHLCSFRIRVPEHDPKQFAAGATRR